MINLLQLGSIRCKHYFRWLYLSKIKGRLLFIRKTSFSLGNMQQANVWEQQCRLQLIKYHWAIHHEHF